ncbi:hypothetical protein F5Y11DRAFT_324060 [Daldinia sp. FL1419]|nr:hypothetical protein F5Y11DRAFT_324060 [Daldinia sp. FL1419]
MPESPQLDPSVVRPITLRAPYKYLSEAAKASKKAPTTSGLEYTPPKSEWLRRTWPVTHSTLSMWRSARNVRITYKPYGDPNREPGVHDNLVEYENKNGKGGVKRVEGIEKPDPTFPGGWNWRGKGLLFIASSHWEVLGYGEVELPCGGDSTETYVESWVVTWFAASLFTQEGIDIYSDRKEGLSKETADQIIASLKKLGVPQITQMVETQMQKVEISLPWKEGKK